MIDPTLSHPKPLMLERYFAGDVHPHQRAAVAQHVEECEDCRAYLTGLSDFKSRQFASLAPAQFMAQLKARAPHAFTKTNQSQKKSWLKKWQT